MTQYTIIRSKRKTVGIQIAADGSVVVRAPMKASKRDIDAIVAKHAQWIEKHSSQRRSEAVLPDFTQEERDILTSFAKEYLPPRVAHYASLMGVEPTGINVTGAKTRYGSCSGKDRLSFSWRLFQYPAEAVDSVIVHELAHIRHKNHGKDFYAFIKSVMPDYDTRHKLLKGLNRQRDFDISMLIE